MGLAAAICTRFCPYSKWRTVHRLVGAIGNHGQVLGVWKGYGYMRSMDDEPPWIDVFDGPARSMAVDVGGIKVRCSRATDFGPEVVMASEPDEAVALIYQVNESGPHDLWLGGKHRRVGPVSAQAVQMLDLDQAGHSRHGAQLDSVNIHIPVAALRRLGPECDYVNNPRPAMRPDWSTRDPFISSLMPALLWTLEEGNELDQLVKEHLFSSLLTHLATAYGAAEVRQRSRPSTLTPRQLNRAKQLLGDDLTRAVSLAEIARECQLSPWHFSRTFKAATGTSPFAWRAQVRVDTAKALLRNGDMPLADVAARCGFADQSHFTRTFSRCVGIPPGSWRRHRI